MPCNRLGGCGAFAFEDKCARESAVSQQKSSLHRSFLVASRGRYWCESAHIAATETPFPEKNVVPLLSLQPRVSSGHQGAPGCACVSCARARYTE